MSEDEHKTHSWFSDRFLHIAANLTARLLVGGLAAAAVFFFLIRYRSMVKEGIGEALLMSGCVGVIVGIFCIRKGPGII